MGAPCYSTRVDLSDTLGERLIRLQKRRERRREAKSAPLAEWWEEGGLQESHDYGEVSGQEESQEVEFTVSPAEMELAAQMAALGLPTVLGGGIKHEVRTLETKKRRKSRKVALQKPPKTEAEPASRLDGSPPSTSQAPSPSGGVNGSPWQPIWDAEYGAFYWFNTESQESHWEVPEGLEAYAAAVYAFEQDEVSGATPEEQVQLAARRETVGDLGGTASEARAFSMCSSPPLEGRQLTEDSGEREESLGKQGVARGFLAKRLGGVSATGTSVLTVNGFSNQVPDSECGASQAGAEERLGPQCRSTGLRGLPRPCGQYIRFADEDDAFSTGGDGGALGGGASQDGSGQIRGEDDGVVDPMEVDDPMEIDTCGGLAKWDRRWLSLSKCTGSGIMSQGKVREKREETAYRGSGSFKPGDTIAEGSDGASLNERQAIKLGDQLLEVTQNRLNGSPRGGTHPSIGLTEGQEALQSGVGALTKEPSISLSRQGFEGRLEISRRSQSRSINASGGPASRVKSTMGPSQSAIDILAGVADALSPSTDKQTPQQNTAQLTGVHNPAVDASIPVISSISSSDLTADFANQVHQKVSAGKASAELATAGSQGGAILLTSAPEANAGAGGDAGGAVLAATLAGREKPADVGQKYWFQRYRLFSRFDQGAQLDAEGWYSVTPEAIAIHHAKRCAGGVVIDAFAGVGGNAIQMTTTSDWVVAIDLDPGRLALAEHNAGVYGVRDKIEFVAGDFLKLAPSLQADALFLSPPWGGPEYNLVETYDLDTMLEPVRGVELFKAALQVTSNIALFLPRNVDLKQLQELAWLASPPLPCEIESNYLCGKLKCITAYYGGLVIPPAGERL